MNCPRCGLPLEACVCETLGREKQKIKVSTEKKSYGKIATIIEGIESEEEMKKIAKLFKEGFACGGTVKNNRIELQGEHRKKAREKLSELGFNLE